MTARHTTESSVLDAQSSRVSSALAAHPDSPIEWGGLLKGLPAERLPELFVYLRTQCSAVQQLDEKPQTLAFPAQFPECYGNANFSMRAEFLESDLSCM